MERFGVFVCGARSRIILACIIGSWATEATAQQTGAVAQVRPGNLAGAYRRRQGRSRIRPTSMSPLPCLPAYIASASTSITRTRDQRATLDLGIADPQRFRGESGGNKSHFTISETDATPSYLPGAIPAGEWRLIIAVPNMRPQVVSHYQAEIRFNSRAEDEAFTAQPLATRHAVVSRRSAYAHRA